MSYRSWPALLSSRAARGICFFFVVVLGTIYLSAAPNPPSRPRILGIAEVHIYSTNVAAERDFLAKLLNGTNPCDWCEEFPHEFMIAPVNNQQKIATMIRPSASTSFLGKVSFLTNDLAGMKKFLKRNGIPFSSHSELQEITVGDPEGRVIGFVQHEHEQPPAPQVYSNLHLIHAGFIVHDRAATEHFYKDILGFRPYWHGGMKDDGKDDWVSLQVPDGTDWIELMVNVSPDADQQVRGIMNHIAIGVTDIHATQQKLIANGVKLAEQPEIGRDGKWQLNVYDPDLTRIEFMEFKPVQKPCCSEFTAPHPRPNQ
ncbi:MAG TPA: VOC family protein [Candidatus Acidoferrum sp.]|nr:VOC family protein [Candidatus Acidoferrum sp.]